MADALAGNFRFAGNTTRTVDEQLQLPPMFDRKDETKFIKSRSAAMVALIVATYLAGNRFWSLVKHRPPALGWIYPLNSWLPNWLAITGNVVTYGLFTLAFVGILRKFEGAERVVFAILFAEILVSPIRQFVTPSVAVSLLWVQAFGSFVMLLGTAQLFQRMSQRGLSDLQ